MDDLRTIQFQTVERFIYQVMKGEYDYQFYMACCYEVHYRVYGVPCGPTLRLVVSQEVAGLRSLLSRIHQKVVADDIARLNTKVCNQLGVPIAISGAILPYEVFMIPNRPQDWELQARKILFTNIN